MTTIIEKLAKFSTEAAFDSLPSEVVHESKRILLDSLGCAVASVSEAGAKRGIAYGQILGGASGPATILGTDKTTSVPGATFANAELINALDQDAVLPPGHVSPYVLPGALATAEVDKVAGSTVLSSIAVSHEMSYRIGKSTDYLRDIKDGVVTIPKVIGYSSTLFGAAAAIGIIKGFDSEVMSDALGIMGTTMPTNTQGAWIKHAPSTTTKYHPAGSSALASVTAANLAELGHTGDRLVLDDRDFGFPRFIGTTRWEPAPITNNLGTEWTFTPFQSYKPYPHCRVMHTLFDGLIDIVRTNNLKPNEIDSIQAWGESFVMEPAWVTTTIRNVRDAQFSMTHGLAMAAHLIEPGIDWQREEIVQSTSVLSLMERTTFQPHPEHAAALAKDPAARMSRIEVTARGQSYSQDRSFPKGSPSIDPASFMTDDELIKKFLHNVELVVPSQRAQSVVDRVFELEQVKDFSEVMRLLRP